MIAIAIDGPSGAGKSTLARHLARRFGLLYVDTGALYRAVAVAVQRQGANPDDLPAVEALLPALCIELRYEADGMHVWLDDEDITGAIRVHDISDLSSRLSAIGSVRAYLLDLQRSFAERYDVVLDGRDIGTVVLPRADLKIFLTADPEERAHRRYWELLERGQTADYAQVLEDVKRRDARDTGRAIAPLRPAEDAVRMDTTGYAFEQSAQRLENLVRERLGLCFIE